MEGGDANSDDIHDDTQRLTQQEQKWIRNVYTWQVSGHSNPDKCEYRRGIDNTGLYRTLNFRNKTISFHKDTFMVIPYLNNLCNVDSVGDFAIDDNGILCVDESWETAIKLIINYRVWLQDNKPSHIHSDYCLDSQRIIVVDCGKRFGVDPKFLKAMTPAAPHENRCDNMFLCYYCGNVYLKDEYQVKEECRYHSSDCKCLDPYSKGCARVFIHSEFPIEYAMPKKDHKRSQNKINQ